jgi:hypothetical protein
MLEDVIQKCKYKDRNAYITIHVEERYIKFAQIIFPDEGMFINKHACHNSHPNPVDYAKFEQEA